MTETSEIDIHASPANVRRAVTEPVLVKQWQYGSGLTTDWTVGSQIRFRNEWEGTVFEQWGTVLEVVPDRLIRYSLFFPRADLEDKPENYFVMGYRLEEIDGGTRLTITKEDNRPGVQGQPDVAEEGENPVRVALRKVAEGL